MNKTTRQELHDAANDVLEAKPDKPAKERIRFRGGWPSMNWLAKQNAANAGSLWQIARARLPEAANDNRSDAAGLSVDRRPSGKPRGPNPEPTTRSIDFYLQMRSAAPRLGDAEPQPVRLPSECVFSEEPRITIKPQRDVFELHDHCRFGFCAPVIAKGAHFLGADSGLGQPRPNNRGETRRVDQPDLPPMPSEIDTVIEVILAHGNVADVGRALGAKGGSADRRGGKALVAAGEWASKALAANDNRVKRYAA